MKGCGQKTNTQRLKIFVEENEAKKWSMIDLKKSEKGVSLPFTVQYEENPAYKGIMHQRLTSYLYLLSQETSQHRKVYCPCH